MTHFIPAALPFAYGFDPATTALIVIDMQRDFVEPGGFGAALGNDVALLRAIIPTVAVLLEGARAMGIAVIHTRECHAPDLSDCPPAKRNRGNPALRIGDAGPMGRILIAGEPGAGIVPELAPLPGETVIDKPGKGAFYATPLGDHLAAAGITHLLFAGVTTEVCVQTTMREANDRGYDCLLVEDATESYFPAFKAATIAMIRAQGGIVGWTATAAQVLAAQVPGVPVHGVQVPDAQVPGPRVGAGGAVATDPAADRGTDASPEPPPDCNVAKLDKAGVAAATPWMQQQPVLPMVPAVRVTARDLPGTRPAAARPVVEASDG